MADFITNINRILKRYESYQLTDLVVRSSDRTIKSKTQKLFDVNVPKLNDLTREISGAIQQHVTSIYGTKRKLSINGMNKLAKRIQHVSTLLKPYCVAVRFSYTNGDIIMSLDTMIATDTTSYTFEDSDGQLVHRTGRFLQSYGTIYFFKNEGMVIDGFTRSLSMSFHCVERLFKRSCNSYAEFIKEFNRIDLFTIIAAQRKIEEFQHRVENDIFGRTETDGVPIDIPCNIGVLPALAVHTSVENSIRQGFRCRIGWYPPERLITLQIHYLVATFINVEDLRGNRLTNFENQLKLSQDIIQTEGSERLLHSKIGFR